MGRGGLGGRGKGGGAKDNNWTPIHDIAVDTPPPSTPFIQMLIDGGDERDPGCHHQYGCSQLS